MACQHGEPLHLFKPRARLPEGVTLEQMMQWLGRQLIESTLRRCN
jgi:hypothetical protein